MRTALSGFDAVTTNEAGSYSPRQAASSIDVTSLQTGGSGPSSQQELWDGSDIVVNINELEIGTYVFELTVYDDSDNSDVDSVSVQVTDTTSPTIDHPADVSYVYGETGPFTIIWTVSDVDQSHYNITRNGLPRSSGDWVGDTISINVEDLKIVSFIQ